MNHDDPSLTTDHPMIAVNGPGAPPEVAAPALPQVPEPGETRFLKWVVFGNHGLRAGWSVTLFLVLVLLFALLLVAGASIFFKKILHSETSQLSPTTALINEAIQLLAIVGAAAVCAGIEHRRLLDYNLTGPRRGFHFITGLAEGIVALTALIGALYWGNWIHFGPVALSGVQILGFGLAWGVMFLLTGFAEEGSVRCYLQFTLTRGINFWWALGLVGAMCLSGLLYQKGDGIWGVYVFSALGLIPCFLLHLSKSPNTGFWQAAWTTSTLFGFIHTGNGGENWIGIFAAAAIGFVFCVSIRLTGSAWWAIGFHASWDWAQTFFFGTADSGLVAQGHYLSTSPAGKTLWSGGTDGPEGSLLIIPLIVLILVGLILIHGRKTSFKSPSTTAQPQLS
jgi:uncharacterized protein